MFADTRKWHFGVLSFTGTGHLIPLLALAQQLRRRGHRVTFFEKPKIERRVREAGLEFISVANEKSFQQDPPPLAGTGLLSDLQTLGFNLARIVHDVESFLANTPAALSHAGVDALIVNEIALTGPTVAQILSLPYFIISTSVPHNFGWSGFRWFAGYRYSKSVVSPLQRALLELSCLRIRGPIRRTLDRYRRGVGLGPVRRISRDYPCLAQITQWPRFLDLPRKSLPDNFYYAGPFVSESASSSVDFPWHRLNGRPLIYASLGTTRNVQPAIFRLIAEACQDLDVQLVISLGNRFTPSDFDDLPGKPLVTSYAPQRELLKLSQVVITHGGPNTAIETLMAGKPMIAIPLAYDQPAIAARLVRLHLAEVLPVMRLSSRRIRAAIIKVLTESRYRDAALEMQARLRSLPGSVRAADVIEVSLDRYASLRPHQAQSRQPTLEVTCNHNDAEAASLLKR